MATKRQTKSSKRSNAKKQSNRLQSLLSSPAYTAIAFVIIFAALGLYFLATGHAATAATTIKGVAGKCLDNKGDQKVSYNKIQLWQCNGTGAQEWTVNASSSAAGTIVNSNGYCLDVYHSGTTSRTAVDLFPCNNTVAQEWVVNNSTGALINPHSGLCLDDQWSGTANGNKIWVYTCNGTGAQKWTIASTSPTGGSVPPTPTPKPKPNPTPTPTPTPAPNPTPTPTGNASAEHIISTLYAYPTLSSWQQVENAAPTVKYAIVNICAPDGSGSGCGRPADEISTDWQPTIAALDKAGVTPLYYISTNYGAEPLATVESELANAKAWYGITDPMFDTTSTTNPSYYQSLYNYAVAHGANTVVFNPGTQVPQSYMFGSREIIQVYEGTADGFRGTSFPSWMKSYPASEFSATLSSGNSSNIGTDVTDASHDNIGNFYEDDEGEPPNYSTLPAYWQTEINDVANVK